MSTASLSLVHDHAGSSQESLVFIGERLWLDFVNSDDASRTRKGTRTDALDTFDGFIRWLCLARLLDEERAAAMTRRAQQQPTGASAALHEARRLRNVLRALAERGADSADRATQVAIAEINRVLGRSAGTRCADPRCARVFFDGSRNGKRRWCEMATCGNRAKAARHRRKLKLES